MKAIFCFAIAMMAYVLPSFAQMPKPQRAEIKTPTAVCQECKDIIEKAVPRQVEGIIKLNVIFKRGTTLVQWYPDRTNWKLLKRL